MKTGSRLLLDEHPLQVLPSLAVALDSLNDAIILQQVHYWLRTKSGEIKKDGRRWIFNGYQDWQEQFPFWHEDTIRRSILRLEGRGLLLSVQEGTDRRKWYTIDYEKMGTLQVAPIHDRKMQSSRPQNAVVLNGTTETTQRVLQR